MFPYLIVIWLVWEIYMLYHLYYFITLVAGWAIISDMVEITSISFVIPVLDNSSDPSLQPTKFQSGALSSVIFVGMMVQRQIVT